MAGANYKKALKTIKKLTKDNILKDRFLESDSKYDERIKRQELELINALRELGKSGDKETVSKLADIMDEFDATFMEPTVSASAAWAIGEIGGESAVRILKEKMKDITIGRALGSAVIEGLGKSGGKEEYAIILDLITDKDPEAQVRKAANKIFSLGENRFLRAALRSIMIMKGIEPSGYDSYTNVPVESYLKGEILPAAERAEIIKKHEQYLLNSNDLLDEFKILAEQYYSSSLNLFSGGGELSSYRKGELAVSALEKAEKTIMSMYGLDLSSANAVMNRYKSSIK